jgi:hypothetical protein
VIFEAAVETGAGKEVLFRRDVDPKNDVAQRHWTDESIDLSRYVGHDVVLIFNTYGIEGTTADWAGWGDLRMSTLPGDTPGQYAKVYDNEVTIFENLHAVPRAFLAQRVVSVPDEASAIAAMKTLRTSPAQSAIVEGAPLGRAATVSGSEGAAVLKSYTTSDVRISVASKTSAFLVLTDSYFPGWIATIDGQRVDIYPTDLAFRGVFVPPGQHLVDFAYRPASFQLGVAIASVGLIVFIAMLAMFHLSVAYVRMAAQSSRAGSQS